MDPQYTFAVRFRSAREKLGWSYRAASKRLGISTRTIQNWQNGEHPAALFSDRRVRAAVARMMGVEEASVLAIVDGIDPSPSLEFTGAQDQGHLTPEATLRAATSRLFDQYPDWLVMQQSAVRGTITRVKYHSLFGIEPHPSDMDRFGALEEARSYVVHTALRNEFATSNLYWRTGNPPGWRSPPELLIQVPFQERSRRLPRSSSRLPSWLQIAVVGEPWAHAELIGSLLADMLSFGYIDLRYTRKWEGRSPEGDGDSNSVRRALRWSGPGYVVASGSRDVFAKHDAELQAVCSRSLVVVCSHDQFMSNVEKWVYASPEGGVAPNFDHNRSVRYVNSSRHGAISVHFGDEAFQGLQFSGDHVSRAISDRACDLSVAAAVKIFRLLSQRYAGLPPATHWIGGASNLPLSSGELDWDQDRYCHVRWVG
jgi:transcriptional regulator with XRE-family HTH domain